MNQIMSFHIKHYYPPGENMVLSKFKKIYSFLPTLITTFPEMPNINNFKKYNGTNSRDMYVSIDKVEMNIINTKNKTISNIFAHVYICFIKRQGLFYPVHVSRINFDTAIINYTKPISM